MPFRPLVRYSTLGHRFASTLSPRTVGQRAKIAAASFRVSPRPCRNSNRARMLPTLYVSTCTQLHGQHALALKFQLFPLQPCRIAGHLIERLYFPADQGQRLQSYGNLNHNYKYKNTCKVYDRGRKGPSHT